MIFLPWRAPKNVFGQLIKLTWSHGSPLGLHTHEYPELFWIDEGPCRHRINGTEKMLEAGDLVFIRASDCHQITALRGRRFTMTNLECQPGLLGELKKRHSEPFGRWFGEKELLPTSIRLDRRQLEQLDQLAIALSTRAPDALNIEGFFFDLARLLTPRMPISTGVANCPDWLQNALLKVQFPAAFAGGPSILAQLAGRSQEHVARLCRKYLQQTPTEVIEHARMTHAEQLLRLSSLSVLEIALECGYGTPAQFHRIFKKHFHRTPHRYRRWIRGS